MIRSIQRPTLLSTNSTRRPEAPSSWWKNWAIPRSFCSWPTCRTTRTTTTCDASIRLADRVATRRRLDGPAAASLAARRDEFPHRPPMLGQLADDDQAGAIGQGVQPTARIVGTASILDVSILHIFMHMHIRIYCHSGISKHCSQTISWRRAIFGAVFALDQSARSGTGLVKSTNARSRGPTAKAREENMAHIVVLGGGIGGVSSAYELKQAIRREDRVTLVSNKPFFQFTPSNPVGGREMAHQERHHHRPRLGAAETWRCLQRRRGGARSCGQQSRRAGGRYLPRLRLPGDRHRPRARLR